VAVLPHQTEQWALAGFSRAGFAEVLSGQDGSFVVSGLADGEYLIVAIPSSRTIDWADLRTLQTLAARGKRVSVNGGVRTDVGLIDVQVMR
jgi:hypothetical protein